MRRTTLRTFCHAAILLISAALIHAQGAQRIVGSITGITGNNIAVKPDAGEPQQIEVPAEAAIKRIEPGQKDLSAATVMELGDLAVGDRVLVKLAPGEAGAPPRAALVIAIKQADVVQKQQKEREDWQRRGISGLVKSVDAGSGVLVVTTGVGPAAKKVSIHTTKATVLRRYAPSSVRFDQAQPAPLDAIHPGDQLRAKGDKNADGTELAAEEVVSGTFRNIAGTIGAIDAAASTLTVKDLASKKQIVIHFTPDAQLRRIPERMALMLAARLKGAAPAGGGAQRPGGGQSHAAEGGGQWSEPGNGGANGGHGGGDPQQMLSRAPAIQLGDLQKGQAVMVVTSEGTSEVNAITLLAGVEPLLEAPEATNLLSNWSMGGGGEGAAGVP